MIIKDGKSTMLYIDVGMFHNPSYRGTLENVFEMEYKNNNEIEVFIKSQDSTVKLNKKDSNWIDPTDLKEFLKMIQEKYDSERNFKEEAEMIDKLKNKIEELEETKETETDLKV